MRRADRGRRTRPGAEVVLQLVPAPGVGTDSGGRVGRAAVRVVDRVVETQPPPDPDASSAEWPKGPGWATALNQLTHQLDTGRVYDRDLAVISTATVALNEALSRRVNARRRRR